VRICHWTLQQILDLVERYSQRHCSLFVRSIIEALLHWHVGLHYNFFVAIINLPSVIVSQFHPSLIFVGKARCLLEWCLIKVGFSLAFKNCSTSLRYRIHYSQKGFIEEPHQSFLSLVKRDKMAYHNEMLSFLLSFVSNEAKFLLSFEINLEIVNFVNHFDCDFDTPEIKVRVFALSKYFQSSLKFAARL